MYRPDGWDTDKLLKAEGEFPCQETRGNFEAGADAMLKALRDSSLVSLSGIVPAEMKQKGRWVFIPDDKE